MGTQGGTGRKRGSNKEKSTAEDDALNLIAREAEARLAAKRAARAEAREIRMKELERQQKEISDDDERMSVGSRSSVMVEGDYLEKGSRAASVLTAGTLTSLGGTSSRRGSVDTAIDADAETSIREIKEIHELKDQIQDVETKYMQNLKEVKDALVATDEKYRKAMVSNAQLDNEKNNLMYQVDTLKDSLMELEELLSESRRECDDKVKEHEREKQAHNTLQFQYNQLKDTLEQSEEMLNEIRQLKLKQDGFTSEISDLNETVEWKDKKIGALERQKEYTDTIRIERDELRDETVQLKDILKKHGIVLGPDLSINGGVEETDGQTQDSQTSPTEGNSVLGRGQEPQLGSSGAEKLDSQHQETFEEPKESLLSSTAPCSLAIVSGDKTSHEEQQINLSSVRDSVEEVTLLKKDSDEDIPITDAQNTADTVSEVGEVIAVTEEKVTGVEVNGVESTKKGDLVDTGVPETDAKTVTVDDSEPVVNEMINDIREMTKNNLSEDPATTPEEVETVELNMRSTDSSARPGEITENTMNEDIPDDSAPVVLITEPHIESESAEEEAGNEEPKELPANPQPQSTAAAGKKKKKKKKKSKKKKGGPQEEEKQSNGAKEKSMPEKIESVTHKGNATEEETGKDPELNIGLMEPENGPQSDSTDPPTENLLDESSEKSCNVSVDKQCGSDTIMSEHVDHASGPTESQGLSMPVFVGEKEAKETDLETEQGDATDIPQTSDLAKEAAKTGSFTEHDHSDEALPVDEDGQSLNETPNEPEMDQLTNEQDRQEVDAVMSVPSPDNESSVTTTNLTGQLKGSISAGDHNAKSVSSIENSKDGAESPGETDALNAEPEISDRSKDESVSVNEVNSESPTDNQVNRTDTTDSTTNIEAELHDPTESQGLSMPVFVGEKEAKETDLETEQGDATDIPQTSDLAKEAAKTGSFTEHDHSDEALPVDEDGQSLNGYEESEDNKPCPAHQQDPVEEYDEEGDEGLSFDFDDMDLDPAENAPSKDQVAEPETDLEVTPVEVNHANTELGQGDVLRSQEEAQLQVASLEEPVESDQEKPTIHDTPDEDLDSVSQDHQLSSDIETVLAEKGENESEEEQHTIERETSGTDGQAHGSDEPEHGLDEPVHGLDEPVHGSEDPENGSEDPANASDEPVHGSEEPVHGSEEPEHGSEEPEHGSERGSGNAGELGVVESNSVEEGKQEVVLAEKEEGVKVIEQNLEFLQNTVDQASSKKESPPSRKDPKKNGKKGKSKGKEDCKMS